MIINVGRLDFRIIRLVCAMCVWSVKLLEQPRIFAVVYDSSCIWVWFLLMIRGCFVRKSRVSQSVSNSSVSCIIRAKIECSYILMGAAWGVIEVIEQQLITQFICFVFRKPMREVNAQQLAVSCERSVSSSHHAPSSAETNYVTLWKKNRLWRSIDGIQDDYITSHAWRMTTENSRAVYFRKCHI